MGELDRYSRQILLPEIGTAGQERLLASSVAVVGCGALGTVISSTLVRAGVGRVRIIDRDYIELNNLQRQILFDEEDIARGLPKAIAAAEKLKKVNSQVKVEPVVADVNPDNVERLIGDVDLILDGTDNFETRLLINDACVKHTIPWIYGAVISTYGMTMSIIPHQTPCFRCFLPEMPLPGSTPTCDTVGVLGAAVGVIASLEVAQALKFLTHPEEPLQSKLIYLDVWTGTWEEMQMRKNKTACPTCDLGQYEFLEAKGGHRVTTLCGRDAVQISPRAGVAPSFPRLADRLRAVGEVHYNDFLLRFRADRHELTIFPDGRTIVKGVGDEAEAKTVYARYVGL
ncbi:MAG: ThiF family adenylyltransferase [Anaerolineae bacterium]|nr:ThiF family adenylyltransferase [Anaerolineae bacterium]